MLPLLDFQTTTDRLNLIYRVLIYAYILYWLPFLFYTTKTD